MEPKKNKWINDILSSSDGIQRVDPSPFLFAKIQNRLDTEASTVYLSARTVWLTIASFALLLLLNWHIISQQSAPFSPNSAELNAVVSDMQLYPSTNQPYDLWSGQSY
ncbi:hypothetical protein [Spirosoma foliorum]|uniref:Uncharacterized protein n=1 Tax=Spirosoma foliorum TaxID=2710596 RepID=A0A7G5GT43_9BACT|nr:hypothetical protein [Spirosoma foliorum]QMW02035.1 hypothetical protein H3H32_29535 [Spirosoma foliorum]